MTMNSYLPTQPQRIPYKHIPRYLIRRVWDNLYLIVSLFVPFKEDVTPPAKDLPSSGTLTVEQRQQAKEIFDLNEARLDGLSRRASSLLSTLGLIAPLELAATGFAWRQYAETGGMPAIVYLLFVASLSLLAIAGWSVIRASNLLSVSWPGIDLLIDQASDKVRTYDIHRDTMCLLWCAMANSAIANRRFDFLRAGTSLVVLSVILLLAGAMILITVPPNERGLVGKLERRIESIEAAQALAANGQLTASRRLDSSNARLDAIEAIVTKPRIAKKKEDLSRSPQAAKQRAAADDVQRKTTVHEQCRCNF